MTSYMDIAEFYAIYGGLLLTAGVLTYELTKAQIASRRLQVLLALGVMGALGVTLYFVAEWLNWAGVIAAMFLMPVGLVIYGMRLKKRGDDRAEKAFLLAGGNALAWSMLLLVF